MEQHQIRIPQIPKNTGILRLIFLRIGEKIPKNGILYLGFGIPEKSHPKAANVFFLLKVVPIENKCYTFSEREFEIEQEFCREIKIFEFCQFLPDAIAPAYAEGANFVVVAEVAVFVQKSLRPKTARIFKVSRIVHHRRQSA